jgi:hypothetical protein
VEIKIARATDTLVDFHTGVDVDELVREQPPPISRLQPAFVGKGRHGLQRIIE